MKNVFHSQATPINEGKKLQYCAWSTQNDILSYVYENNVYLYDENNAVRERKITEDGIDGVFYNGVPDWVYEEEVGF